MVYEVYVPSTQPSDDLIDFTLILPWNLPVLPRNVKAQTYQTVCKYFFYMFKKYFHFMLYVFSIDLTKLCMEKVIPSFKNF